MNQDAENTVAGEASANGLQTEGQKCSVEGCGHEAYIDCDLCGQPTCKRHTKATVCLEVCWSCHIGLSEGMPEDMKGLW